MARSSPLDAAMWQALIDIGEVRCRGCDEFVDLSGCEEINDGVEVWNEHVRSCDGDAEAAETT